MDSTLRLRGGWPGLAAAPGSEADVGDKPSNIEGMDMAETETQPVVTASADKTKDDEDEDEERETWDSKVNFILTLVGYAVGFGNIWRFPYLFHSNGGMAFLVPYSIMLFIAGLPIFFLELAVGQRFRKGALGSWNEINPYLAGIGLAQGIVCAFIELYYNTLVAWVLLYFFDSFRTQLQWQDCSTPADHSGTEPYGYRYVKLNQKKNEEEFAEFKAPVECLDYTQQATKYYWYRRMLDVSESVTDPGQFNPWMLLSIMICWLMVFAIIAKGVKVSGKVVWFTALFPYVTLTIMFISNFFFDGWREGYSILLTPDWSKLKEPKVWLLAGSQIFFSLGVSYGCLIAFASHNKPNNNVFRDAVSVSFINCGTSLYAAMVLFPIFGILGKTKFDDCTKDRLVWALLTAQEMFQENFTQAFNVYCNPSKFKKKFDKYKHKVSLPLTPDAIFIDDYRDRLLDCFTLSNKSYEICYDDQVHSGNITYIHQWLNEKKTKSAPIADLSFPNGLVLKDFSNGASECMDLESYVRGSGSGTGLVFIGIAEAVLQLGYPPIWSFLFFLMLLTLGIDSSFGTLEGVVAVAEDMKIFKCPRWVLTAVITGILAFFSLIFCWGWGMYILNFLDQFLANWSLLIIGALECIAMAWVYGLANFAYEIKLMCGRRPPIWIMMCWKFITPLVIFILLGASVIQQFMGGFTYSAYNHFKGDTEDKPQPWWLVTLGFLLWIFNIMWVPIQFILAKLGMSLFGKEKPSTFNEQELRDEHQLGDFEESFDNVDRIVMGRKSIDNFNKRAKGTSNTNIQQKPPGPTTPQPEASLTATPTTPT